jgi:hypothetical protein
MQEVDGQKWTKLIGASLKFVMQANDKIIVTISEKIKSLKVKQNIATECPRFLTKNV